MKYKIAFSKMIPVGKIAAGDDDVWRVFNGSFDNMEVEQVEALDLIYRGHPFTTWHKDHWRHSKNYICGQHIGIDFDTEDERSTLAFLIKDSFVRKYAAIAYTTPSHTPEAPRGRIVFTLDKPIMQAANYALAATALLWLFGSGDRQCKDAARFFYGSVNCDMEWLGQELPVEKLKAIISQYQASGQLAKRIHTNKNYKPTADQQEVAAALKAIQPWSIEYNEWLKVLMAIHQAFGDAGLALAAQWGDGAQGEVERKWKTFHDRGNPAGIVTLNTVFKMARERGWQGAQAA